MSKFFLLLLLLSILQIPFSAYAEEVEQKTRTRFTLHKEHELSHLTELSLKFVLADDVLKSNAPIVAVGFKRRIASWMSGEIAIGWAGTHNEPLIELSLSARRASLWATLTSELRTRTLHGYWFAQGEYALYDSWLYAGLENESWGSYAHGNSWTVHTGPNLIFRFKSIEVDLAVHMDGNLSSEMVTRIHLFL